MMISCKNQNEDIDDSNALDNKAIISKASADTKRQALTCAAQWYAQLCADDVNNEDKAAWQAWLIAEDDLGSKLNHQGVLNQWAWQQVERLQSNLQQFPHQISDKVAVNSLSHVEGHFNQERRTAMRSLMVILGTGSVGWLGYRHDIMAAADFAMADQRSKTGEVRTLALPDGSEVTLNTDSAIDINFSGVERRIVLRQGEIMVQTAKVNTLVSTVKSTFENTFENKNRVDYRPFIVETDHGDIQALGTRFSVRHFKKNVKDTVQVNVYQHSVRVTNNNGTKTLCPAGNSLNFTASTFQSLNPNTVSDAWTQQMLVVLDMPLTDFINEINRYRTGFLRCDKSLAKHRISGTFNTQDTAQVLRAVEKSFPVKVTRFSRFWVNISPSA
jgi:transmembrane sensor